MLTIEESDGDVLIVQVSGQVETAELDQITTRIERSLEAKPKTNILAEIIGFSGFDSAALTAHIPRALRMFGKRERFGRVAVVADQKWVRAATRFESALIPGLRYEVFTPDERDQALAWVKGRHVLPHLPALRIIETDRPNVIGYELDGRLTAPEVEIIADYFSEVLKQPGQVRILGRIRNFAGMEPSVALNGKYLAMKLAALGKVERYAIVGGPAWVGSWAGLIAAVVQTELRCFELSDEAAAWDWLGANPKEERVLAA